MAIKVSDYNRAGIFIEEINNSVIQREAASQALINFVPGFSRKGTVFNRPVLINSSANRQTYFKDIDRTLEKKGSYFHRTLDIATQTAPVWALNILKTTEDDKLNYASVSVSAQYDNDIDKESQYDTFFNKSGFWQRDTESFLHFARNEQRMIHFTNMSDKKISVFMFKSDIKGYDVTAETWYNGKDKVPSWMNYSDLISDYYVRVIVIGGDWSEYNVLAADSNWSKYFDNTGLKKDKVDSFIRDKAVNLLGDYTGSLIPYFYDAKNNQVFIETLINLDTDITGLFCAYDIDNVETDYPTGAVDIIGQNLVDNEKTKVDFMSYQDTIIDSDSYEEKQLDSLGNVFGLGTIAGRTYSYNNYALDDSLDGFDLTLSNPSTLTPTVVFNNLASPNGPIAIINNQFITIPDTSILMTPLDIPTSGNTTYRIDVLYISADGTITLKAGTREILTSGYDESTAVANGLTYPSVPNAGVVLGYYFRKHVDDSPNTYTTTYVPVSFIGDDFIPLTIGTGNLLDSPPVDITVEGSGNTLTLIFNGTATTSNNDYKNYRRLQYYNDLITKLANNSGQSVIITPSGDKVSFTYTTTASGDKSITFTSTETIYNTSGFIVYFKDDEFIPGTLGIETRNSINGTTGYGIVAKYSEFYQDYYNGMINSGNYFYNNLGDTTSLQFLHSVVSTGTTTGSDWIIMNSADKSALGLDLGDNSVKIFIDKLGYTNNGTYSFKKGYNSVSISSQLLAALTEAGITLGSDFIFEVSESVSTNLNATDITVYDAVDKIYLKMYTLGADLTVEYMSNDALQAQHDALSPYPSVITVYSGKSNYEQTLEIEQHDSYTITDTKFLIDMVRYPEVKVGDYIKAFVDIDSDGIADKNESVLDIDNNQIGLTPKKFARIVKKQPWSGNAVNNVQWAEITTDIKIDIVDFGGDLQTMRYTKIQDYIDTYKAITLGAFTVKQTAIPDGSELKQNEILNVIGKGTSLYNAIVNKNKFQYRYLIDSWGNGLTEFSKQQLADICGKRKNNIGFLNMPSAKAFKNSTSTYFTNADGTLNMEYVRQGGDLEKNPAFLYSFASGEGKDDGRDTVGYFFPYVTVNDNGRPLDFPPAAYIANTYTRKLNSSTAGIYNWTIAAGSDQGLILGISDTEMDFTEADYESMFAMGANPISYAKNIGFYIETEWTASVQQLSSLSFLHCREVLIDLENDLYAMLFKYQWKFNIPSIRAKIKREADDICQSYVDRNALYAYENIIDDSNNTPFLIDNQFGFLETKIEISKGLMVIVNQISIFATGQISGSSGFGAA